MRRVRAVALTALMWGMVARPALADVTTFIGANTIPANRQVRGFALGVGLIVGGFEVEYANTTDDSTMGAPSLKTGSVNIQVQTPLPILGFQPYVTAGAGLYNETLPTYSHTGLVLNTGGGVRMSLIGPVRLRLDYRIFKLTGALESPAHRVYAGLTLGF